MMKQINPQKQPHKQRTVILIILVILTAFAIVMIGFLKNTVLVSYPVLKGLPEVGKWYSIVPEGTKSSDGSEWHGLLRLGTENKVVVYFFGGGASITGETSERGTEFCRLGRDWKRSGGKPVQGLDIFGRALCFRRFSQRDW